MLCQLSHLVGDSLVGIWMFMNVLMFISIFVSSASMFYLYYWPSNITFQKWQQKSNPAFPPPEKIREEIVTMLKGMLCSTICPALSVYLAVHNSPYTQGFCGLGDRSALYHVLSVTVLFFGSDFYEFAYHRLGHVNFTFWQQHRHHHVFANPSPFAVIADEWVDQFFRSAPLLFVPFLMPISMDLMFIMYAVLFYFYGVYLHLGFEVGLSAHNAVFNTSFQHYCHHAKSIINKPYHCGFFIKIWDQLFQCEYPRDRCFCAECARAKGERTEAEFRKVVIPDYSLLLKPSFWIGPLKKNV